MIQPDFDKPLTALVAGYYGVTSGLCAALNGGAAWSVWCALTSHLPNPRPSHGRIEKLTGLGRSSVTRSLKLLADIGAIKYAQNRTGRAKQDGEEYEIADVRREEIVKTILDKAAKASILNRGHNDTGIIMTPPDNHSHNDTGVIMTIDRGHNDHTPCSLRPPYRGHNEPQRYQGLMEQGEGSKMKSKRGASAALGSDLLSSTSTCPAYVEEGAGESPSALCDGYLSPPGCASGGEPVKPAPFVTTPASSAQVDTGAAPSVPVAHEPNSMPGVPRQPRQRAAPMELDAAGQRLLAANPDFIDIAIRGGGEAMTALLAACNGTSPTGDVPDAFWYGDMPASTPYNWTGCNAFVAGPVDPALTCKNWTLEQWAGYVWNRLCSLAQTLGKPIDRLPDWEKLMNCIQSLPWRGPELLAHIDDVMFYFDDLAENLKDRDKPIRLHLNEKTLCNKIILADVPKMQKKDQLERELGVAA